MSCERLPLAGKEEVDAGEPPVRHYQKHSEARPFRQLKLDSAPTGRHTQATMTRQARALELPSPLPAQVLVLGLVLLTIIVVILPR
jgi:hypothetical protein